MSERLDGLLKDMNDSLKGRQEGDLSLGDSYWAKRDAYQKALAEEGNVHIPVNKDEKKLNEPQKKFENLPITGSVPVTGSVGIDSKTDITGQNSIQQKSVEEQLRELEAQQKALETQKVQ